MLLQMNIEVKVTTYLLTWEWLLYGSKSLDCSRWIAVSDRGNEDTVGDEEMGEFKLDKFDDLEKERFTEGG